MPKQTTPPPRDPLPTAELCQDGNPNSHARDHWLGGRLNPTTTRVQSEGRGLQGQEPGARATRGRSAGPASLRSPVSLVCVSQGSNSTVPFPSWGPQWASDQVFEAVNPAPRHDRHTSPAPCPAATAALACGTHGAQLCAPVCSSRKKKRNLKRFFFPLSSSCLPPSPRAAPT